MTTPISIDVPTSSLLRLIADVRPFAASENVLPLLNGINFEFADTDLLAVATDRYMLGVSRLPVGAKHISAKRSLRIEHIDALVKAFRPPKGHDPMLSLTFGDESLAVETTATLDGKPTLAVAYPWAKWDYPTWRGLIEPVPADAQLAYLQSFNPTYFAKFAHLQRDNAYMRIWNGPPSKPLRVTFGTYFVGLIMPVRDEVQDVWEPAAINVAEPVKAAPRKRAPRASKRAA